MSNIGSDDDVGGLGVDAVEIMRSRTRLNYDVCASNLVDIFEMLGSRLPGFRATSLQIAESIKVIEGMQGRMNRT